MNKKVKVILFICLSAAVVVLSFLYGNITGKYTLFSFNTLSAMEDGSGDYSYSLSNNEIITVSGEDSGDGTPRGRWNRLRNGLLAIQHPCIARFTRLQL